MITLFLFTAYALYTLVFFTTSPTIKNGSYEYDANSKGVVPLSGDWLVYPDVLIDPSQPNAFAPYAEQAQIITVPSSFESTSTQKIQLATYRLRIKVAEDQLYGVRTEDIRYANRMYINGQLVGESGVPSADLSSYKANAKKYIGVAQSEDRLLDIVIQVANANYHTTGLVQAPMFANYKQMMRHATIKTVLEATIIIGFLTIGLFYLRSFYRSNQTHAVYFSLFTISQAFYQSLLGERLFELISGPLPIRVLTSLQLSILFLSTLLFYLFITNLYTINIPSYLKRITVGALYFAIAWYTTFYWFLAPKITIPISTEQFLIVFLLIPIYGQIIYSSLISIRNRKSDTSYILLATAAFFLYLITLLLNFLFEIQLAIAQFYLLIMIVSFAILITERYYTNELQLKKLTQDLVIQDRLKDEFLQRAAMELHKPLMDANTKIKQVVEGDFGTIVKEQQHALLLVQNIHKRLLQIVIDLKDASKAYQQHTEIKPTAISMHAIKELVDELYFINRNADLRLIQQIDEQLPAISMDTYRFQQVIYNIMNNALRFTPQGTITVSTAMLDENTIQLTVKDTGIGISAEHLPHIFTAFYQVNPIQVSTQHLGLGLTITKQLLNQAGGDIIIKSTVNKGTTLLLQLPIAKKTAQRELQTYTTHSQPVCSYISRGSSTTILIVDDYSPNLTKMIEHIKPMGFTIIAVTSAQDALDVLATKPIDLALIDLMMPSMPGDVLARQIRQSYDMVQLPILLMTSLSTINSELIEELQINDCLVKPLEPLTLQNKIALFLSIKDTALAASKKELRYYIAQISPHFLYNTMNTLIGLSYERPEKVSDGLMHLTTYFRAKLDFFTKQELVPLDEEMELVEAYLAIEHLRFENRLQTSIINRSTQHAVIPTLALQTLVENSIVHGILKRHEGGKLEILIEDVGADVVITITDNGVGMSEEHLQQVLATNDTNGVGIANTLSRIKMVEHATIHFTSRLTIGTTITISLRSQNV